MKKTISLLVALTMIVTSLSIAFPVFADTGAEVDTVVDELSELYQEEGKMIKALKIPPPAVLSLKQILSRKLMAALKR